MLNPALLKLEMVGLCIILNLYNERANPQANSTCVSDLDFGILKLLKENSSCRSSRN